MNEERVKANVNQGRFLQQIHFYISWPGDKFALLSHFLYGQDGLTKWWQGQKGYGMTHIARSVLPKSTSTNKAHFNRILLGYDIRDGIEVPQKYVEFV